MMPRQKPGLSKQDYGTPPALLTSLRKKLGITQFAKDLAASHDNAVCPSYFTEEDDALVKDWRTEEALWNFCNPPFANIEPWVKKAMQEGNRGAYTAMLLPASVGSNWWKYYVEDVAYILFLNGRLTFVGETKPYPKDCAVILYAPMFGPVAGGGSRVWSWRTE